MRMRRLFWFLMVCMIAIIISACQKQSRPYGTINRYAKGFAIEDYIDYKLLKIYTPWRGADKTYRYVLLSKGQSIPDTLIYDAVVHVPVSRMVGTSTTQIPDIEHLGVLSALVGFVGTKYISSKAARERIDSEDIVELSQNGKAQRGIDINMEELIDVQPDLVLGSSTGGTNRSYDNISRMGIPVVYDGAWVSDSPLARAEWIKMIGALFGLESRADSLFRAVEQRYLAVKSLADNVAIRPKVISGALYKDTWYVPSGDSWVARFFKDAGADYLWKDIEGGGSLPLSFESVLDRGIFADYWIGCNQYITYTALQKDYARYNLFNPFNTRKIYTYNKTKGATGGILYYEEGLSCPDIILKDLIYILHPKLLPNHKLYFYQSLD